MPTDDLAPLDVATPFRLDRSMAVVTGASSGLGLRFARVLHAAGAAVVVAARRVERLEALAASHERMQAIAADVTIAADRERIVAAAASYAEHTDRRFDVLVNNAGIGDTIPALDETAEGFAHVLDVNLSSLFHLSQLAAERFIAGGGGTIVNVAVHAGPGRVGADTPGELRRGPRARSWG